MTSWLNKDNRKTMNKIKRDIAKVAKNYLFEDIVTVKKEYRKFWRNLKKNGLIKDYNLSWDRSNVNEMIGEVFVTFVTQPTTFVQLTMSIVPTGGKALE